MTTTKTNRKELQNKISELYNSFKDTNAYDDSIPNGEIEDILRKNTNSLVIVYESMLHTVRVWAVNNYLNSKK